MIQDWEDFFGVAPLTSKYPYNSPYAFSENRVVDGIEKVAKTLGYCYTGIANYVLLISTTAATAGKAIPTIVSISSDALSIKSNLSNTYQDTGVNLPTGLNMDQDNTRVETPKVP